MKPLIFVGDIHNQLKPFNKVVEEYQDTHHIVFLGDLNDSDLVQPESESSFLSIFNKVKSLVENDQATLIQSNHQKNLITTLTGGRVKAIPGMINTLSNLQKFGLVKFQIVDEKIDLQFVSQRALDIADWLAERPIIFEAPGVVGVHAQFISGSKNNNFRSCCLYGSRKDNARVQWWHDYTGSPYIVAGHYHVVYQSEDCAIIDGGCGHDGDLYVLEWPNKTIKKIEV